MAKKITVYTKNTCAYCTLVKKWLGAKGFQYEEVNIDIEPNRHAEAIALTGATTVPVTVVTNEDATQSVVIGFNLQKLAPALA